MGKGGGRGSEWVWAVSTGYVKQVRGEGRVCWGGGGGDKKRVLLAPYSYVHCAVGFPDVRYVYSKATSFLVNQTLE